MTEAKKMAEQVAEVQRIILPAGFPVFPGYSFALHYQPCEAAGGDFYGWGVRDDGSLGFGVADVSGHGVRAAMVVAMLRAWFVAYRYFARPPDLMVRDLNGFFAEIGELNSFVTIVLARFEPLNGKFSFRNCGHPSPKIRKRDGNVVTLDGARSLPLGILVDQAEIDPHHGQLESGDAMILYTDGIPESVNEDGSFFDPERLDEAITNCDGLPDSIVKSIVAALQKHRGKHRQRDDECILVIARD